MINRKLRHRLLVIGFVLAVLLTCPMIQQNTTYAVTVPPAKSINYYNTGNQATDIVGVAATQIGYKEGTRYWTKNKYVHVPTAYGSYFRYDNEWCAIFICWCARKAGIGSGIIPRATFASPSDFYGKYYKRGSITPKKGDLIFFGNSTHVGLVESAGKGYVHTIEGNTDNGRVARHTFKLSSSWIMGYKRPNYKTNSQTYTLKYTDEISSQASCDAKISSQTMKCAAFVPTTTKKFTRSYYSYNNWYIKKYFNKVAYYWCRDIATGQKGAWIKWSSFAKQKYGRTNTYNGYRKVELKHGGSLYFGEAQSGQTIYLTPAWTRNTFIIAYVDGISSTNDDTDVISSQIAYCGDFNPTSSQKFTRPGYHYNTRFIKKYENGVAYYWCREKSTRANPKWIRYDQIPSTYYKENGAVGNTVWFNDEIKGRTLYITPEWIKDDGAAVEYDEEFYDVYLDDNVDYGLDETEDSKLDINYDAGDYSATPMAGIIYSLNRVHLSKPKATKKSVKISWKSVKGANTYKVAYKLKKAKRWTFVICNSNKMKIKKLKKKAKYVVKVRAIHTFDRSKVYGKWSNIKTVIVK